MQLKCQKSRTQPTTLNLIYKNSKYGFYARFHSRTFGHTAQVHLPFVQRQMFKFWYSAPMLFRHQCQENLYKIHECNEKRKWNHQKEEYLLISTEFTNMRQHIIEIYGFHFISLIICAFYLIFIQSIRISQITQHNVTQCTSTNASRTFIFKCHIHETTVIFFRIWRRCNGHNNIGCRCHCPFFFFFQPKIEFLQNITVLSLLFYQLITQNFVIKIDANNKIMR